VSAVDVLCPRCGEKECTHSDAEALGGLEAPQPQSAPSEPHTNGRPSAAGNARNAHAQQPGNGKPFSARTMRGRFGRILEQAHADGLYVLPACEDLAEKHPCISWTEFQTRRPTSEEENNWLVQYPDRNGCYVTGATMGRLVLDADGIEAIEWVEKRGGVDGAQILESRPGRFHYHFAYPDFRVYNSAAKLFCLPDPDAPEGVRRNLAQCDVRGEGGIAVAAGSLHHTGSEYHWVEGHGPQDIPLVPPPAWLLDWLRTHSTEKQTKYSTPIDARPFRGTVGAWAKTIADGELDRLRSAPDGAKNCTLASVSFKLGQLVGGGEAEEADVIAALYDIADNWPNSTKSRGTIDNCFEAGTGHPRSYPGPKISTDSPYNGGGASPADAQPSVLYTQDSLALLFTKENGEELRFVAMWGQWFKWQDCVWRRDETLHVFDMVRTLCRRVSTELPPEDKSTNKLKRELSDARTIAAVERLAKSDRQHAATITQWDANLMLLNTPGGIIDLETGRLRPSQPHDYCTKITAVAPAITADCPNWKKFLKRVLPDDELVEFLQRMAGYILTGNVNEHALFFFYGIGSNGKSTVVNTLLRIMQDYAVGAPTETFMMARNDRHPTEIADLQGARLVAATEIEQGQSWADARISHLTGGDPVKARYMRQDFFQYWPQFKLLISGNHKPSLHGVTEAIRRRFHLVPFNVTIPPHERDTNFAKHQLEPEWPQILRWMIDGCREWQQHGLNPPPAITDATGEYLQNEDTIALWIAECCTLQPQLEGASSALFASWKQWAEQRNEFVGTQRKFSQALEQHGYKSRHTERGTRFVGITPAQSSFNQNDDNPTPF
jgi:putative DNA primase/helicase